MSAVELIAAWERQQEVYIPQREARFELMMDVIAHRAGGERLRVLDLACGPGSATARVLARFPHAEVVAVDLDPLLLELARVRDVRADHPPRWMQADLTDPEWIGRLPVTQFDAVVSTTALHWLNGSQLSDLYRRVRPLVAPGGVLLNGDYLPESRPWGELAGILQAVGQRRERAAVAAGALDWEAWWDAVRADPELAAQLAARDAIFADRPRHDAPSRQLHVEALRDSGFTEVQLIWQDLAEGLICALAPPHVVS